eukprot:CAMPEP_0202891540 /NCGR_PEP_ID=MMETSP1392-20130828/1580_1 /ASSEMBLY_ACC=CAM_ASM_000868 /TAXON_ID=225041 /ORGANISM="Chlamydomonas chlamydogama, Strain SAG 11-48b" /LENGTH=58 /DNA_ID=CAMNT_0049575325 /DNA_START=545 /DNA_END=718 /DNA_ORIENTATION=+
MTAVFHCAIDLTSRTLELELHDLMICLEYGVYWQQHAASMCLPLVDNDTEHACTSLIS